MNIQNITVDTQAIADGLYAIICQQGEDGVVAFGMIPKWIMDLLEGKIVDKLVSMNAAYDDVPESLIREHLDQVKLRAVVDPIMNQVCTDIFGAAKKAGNMIV